MRSSDDVMCSPSSEDAWGEVGERHGRGRRRRAHHACRGEARARVRGKTGRVSAPRAVPSRDDARQNGIPHSDATVRKTLVFLSRQRGRFRRVTRVSTSRVPSWGVSCLFQPQRGRSRAPSPRATSPEPSFGSTDHANPRSAFRFVFRALALTSRRRTRSLVRPMLGRRRVDRRDEPTRFTAVPRASPSASRRP